MRYHTVVYNRKSMHIFDAFLHPFSNIYFILSDGTCTKNNNVGHCTSM